jgi:outer membrane biosynthesis protein TonB
MNYSPGANAMERASLNRARRARASVRRPGIRRGVAVSAGLHVLILVAALVTLQHDVPPPPPEEESFSVEFSGSSAHAQKGEKPAQVAAPTDSDMPVTDNPAVKPPEHAPIETAPPPPPPPPPPPLTEPDIKPPDVKMVEPPKPSTTPAPVKPPPPKVVAKPPPVPTPPPVIKSTRSQPHPTKTAVPDTRALDNTLEKFMADQTQKAPPTHRYNPERGGKLHGGGSKTGGLTGELSDGQRKQIGDDVRRCYSEDTAARDYAKYTATIVVTIDATGEARDAVLSPADIARGESDAAFRAFAERAVRAVLDPTCAKLPVPPELLGKPSQTLNFRFRP